MKSILLINPCYNKKHSLGFFSKYITSQLPLSIGSLAGYLLSKNIDVTIIDEQLKQTSESRLRAIIESKKIKAVGLSVLTLTANRAYELGTMIRRNWPDIKVIMGGIHVTFLPQEPLENGAADVVVRGEGEIVLHELIEKIYAAETYECVPGISFFRNNRINNNSRPPLINNLDILPPFPYHLFKRNINCYQFRFGTMITSRGCPYSCIFCSQGGISGRQYRTQSPQRILEELTALVYEYEQDFVFFSNDNFIVDRNEVYDLCDRIIARRFPKNLKLGINARGDSVDMPILKRLREAHFNIILFGLETGSERVMKLVKKGETVRQIAEGVKLAKQAGFIVGGQFILGFPTETREESIITIKHALKIPVDFTRFSLLIPYPGSEIFEILDKKKGEIIKKKNWSNYGGGLSGKVISYIPEGRSPKELLCLQWIGHLVFYARPQQLFNLHKLKYALAGQISLPDPRSWKGLFELVFFVCYLIFFFLINFFSHTYKSKRLKYKSY